MLLIRHGETTWAAQGRHTGRTDIELTEAGRDQSRRLGAIIERLLDGRGQPVVFTSPLARARDTAALAMPRVEATETDLLFEVDYGQYEGLTGEEIGERHPGWSVFADGCPGGESVAAVAARCDSFIAKAERMAPGRPVVAFSHGHLSRALTARVLGLPVPGAGAFYNDTATIAVFDHRKGVLVLTGWNLSAG